MNGMDIFKTSKNRKLGERFDRDKHYQIHKMDITENYHLPRKNKKTNLNVCYLYGFSKALSSIIHQFNMRQIVVFLYESCHLYFLSSELSDLS